MYVRIDVTPDAKKERIERVSDTHYKIAVREPAERNLANGRVIDIVRQLHPEARYVRLVSGHRSPRKIISVE
jgi:uncharacterized protein YggU (UPF0235/DUF167 family)